MMTTSDPGPRFPERSNSTPLDTSHPHISSGRDPGESEKRRDDAIGDEDVPLGRQDGGNQQQQQRPLPSSSHTNTTSTTHSTSSEDDSLTRSKTASIASSRDHQPSIWNRIYDTIYWVPPHCRYDPASPPKFSIWLNILFGFAGAFTVANLYYNHPILNILAADFGVDYVQVSQIPTLAQAGYAAGLLFLCPLGDMLPRRPFVLTLVCFTATMCVGLAVTGDVAVFKGIQFVTAVTTVTPQLMMPLVGDLAPPHRRAFALSIVTTGLMLGILLARLLSGVVTQYTSWRTVYWMSVGLQYAIFASLWAFMPDYPRTNRHLNYFRVLWSIPGMLTKHPVLVQACLVSFFTSATFTNFWTVLTFLLAGEPYRYSPVVIGLFALIGICAMCFGPVYARFVTDRFVPLFTVLLGMCWCLTGITIGTYTGTFTVVGPVLQALFNDFGTQTSQIANRSAIFTVEPKGRNRVNTAYMVFTFAGQLTGTSVGANLFEKGGWVASGSYSLASICVALLVTLSRGPWEEGWVGWHGGWSICKKDRSSADGKVRVEGGEPRPLGNTDEEKGDGKEQPDLHEHEHERQHEQEKYHREALNSTGVDLENRPEMRATEEAAAASNSKAEEIVTIPKKLF